MNTEQLSFKRVGPLPKSTDVMAYLKTFQADTAVPVIYQNMRTCPLLFSYYPGLGRTLSFVQLGDFPTPILKLDTLGHAYDIPNLYMKREDFAGPLDKNGLRVIGGNKVRKLEFLLGDACARGAKTVMTFGCAGSNHALATAAYANRVGMKAISVLRPQDNSAIVRRNLLLQQYYGAQLHEYPTGELRALGGFFVFLRHKQEYGEYPYFIPTGGSCPLGELGFVNAAFELKQQIDRGELPEPDYIYLPLGSMGTTAGLMIGLKAAGLKSQVRAVRVDDYEGANEDSCLAMIHEMIAFIREHDSRFPDLAFTCADMHIIHDFFGDGYGVVTPEAQNAIEKMHDACGITLEGTYSGKTFAALLHDLEKPELKNKTILFWNTFCGLDYSSIITENDYTKLPFCFYKYFEPDHQ
jgi:D-cysteine desulfhydrase